MGTAAWSRGNHPNAKFVVLMFDSSFKRDGKSSYYKLLAVETRPSPLKEKLTKERRGKSLAADKSRSQEENSYFLEKIIAILKCQGFILGGGAVFKLSINLN